MNKMSKVILSVFASVALCASTVSAETSDPSSGLYISGNIGAIQLSDSSVDLGPTHHAEFEYDASFLIGVAAGYNFGISPSIRAEGEYMYSKSSIDSVIENGNTNEIDGDFTVQSFLMNVYYDISTNSQWTPFISAGMGLVYGELSGDGSVDDSVFAWQVGAGVAYLINNNFAIDGRYRYLVASDLDLAGLNVECAGHQLTLGIRYTF